MQVANLPLGFLPVALHLDHRCHGNGGDHKQSNCPKPERSDDGHQVDFGHPNNVGTLVSEKQVDWLLTLLAFLPVLLPVAFFFQGCPCCGAVVCAIADHNSSFTDVAGVWAAFVTSSANAIKRCDVTHPDGVNGNRALIVSMGSTAVGDKPRAMVDYVDASNYLAVELEVGATCSLVRVIRRSGGVDSTSGDTMDYQSPDGISLQIYYKPAGPDLNLKVEVPGARAFWRTVSPVGGDRVALGTSTLTGTATFTGFEFNYHPIDDAINCDAPSCVIFEGATKSCEWDADTGFDFAAADLGANSNIAFDGAVSYGTGATAICDYEDGSRESGYEELASYECGVTIFKTHSTTPGQTHSDAGLIFDWLDDDNYHMVFWEAGSGVFPGTGVPIGGRLYLKRRAAGAFSTVHEFGYFNSSHIATLSVCVTDDIVIVNGTPEESVANPPSMTLNVRLAFTPHGGTKFGFYADVDDADDDVTFSDWYYRITSRCGVNDEERPCIYCGNCFADLGVHIVKVVMAGITGCTACTDRNGTHLIPAFNPGEDSNFTQYSFTCATHYDVPPASSSFFHSGGGTSQSGTAPCPIWWMQRYAQIAPDIVIFGIHVDTPQAVFGDGGIDGLWYYTLAGATCTELSVTSQAMTVVHRLNGSSGVCSISAATASLTLLPTAN